MSYACTHIDLSTQERCCATLGELSVDSKGAAFCGTSSHEEFLSCAGVDSKCSVFLEERQGEYFLTLASQAFSVQPLVHELTSAASSAVSAAEAGASAAKSGASHAASAAKSAASNAASHVASATHAAGASASHAASGSHSASAGAKSSAAAKKKKSAGHRAVPSVAAAFVLAVAVAAVVS